MSDDRRFPFPLPFGWFSAGRLDELDPGAVVPLRAAGTDLAVWHANGAWHVFDAYCPHLGAHLGVGGRVDDAGCLVCPFHEWVFDGDGANVSIPYADRPNRKARVRSYPTMVRNRMLFFWWHPDPEVEPSWDIVEVLDRGDDERLVECQRFTRQVKSYWQELAENAVDMAHFTSVHGLSTMGQIGELDIEGPIRRVHSKQSFLTARGEFEGSIESTSFGPGAGIVRFELMSMVTLVSATTPIEDGLLEIRQTMYHRDGDEMGAKIGEGFGAEVQRQFDQDIPIWEAKRYQPSPALAPIEKPITEFRRWASQFYA